MEDPINPIGVFDFLLLLGVFLQGRLLSCGFSEYFSHLDGWKRFGNQIHFHHVVWRSIFAHFLDGHIFSLMAASSTVDGPFNWHLWFASLFLAIDSWERLHLVWTFFWVKRHSGLTPTMCTIPNILQSLLFFVHVNLYFPCSCCSCSSTSTSSCCFSFLLVVFPLLLIIVIIIIIIFFFLLLLLLLLFFFFFFLPLFNILPFPLLLTKWHLGQLLPDQRIGSWHLGWKDWKSNDDWGKLPEIHSKSTWKLAPKIVPKGNEASSNDGFSGFFLLLVLQRVRMMLGFLSAEFLFINGDAPHDKNSNTNNFARNFWQYLSNRNQLKFDYSYLILSKKSVGWILLLTN